MDVKQKLDSLIKGSELYLTAQTDLPGLQAAIEQDISIFLSSVDNISDETSKDDYIKFVDSICALHYDYTLIGILEAESVEMSDDLVSLKDELNSILTASDSPIHFSEEDRDLMVIGKLIFMSIYYQGNPTDQNAEQDPVELTDKSYSKFKMTRLSSKKLQKHMFRTAYWHLLK